MPSTIGITNNSSTNSMTTTTNMRSSDSSSEVPKILIFLDIDGVLLPFPDNANAKSTCGAIFPDDNLAALSVILQAFSTTTTAPLYQIEVILSSTWRAQPNLIQEILDSFELYGKAFGGPLKDLHAFADMTDPEYHTERQHEIYKYMFANPNNTSHKDNHGSVVAWVALDDEELLEGPTNAKYRSKFEGHVVKTCLLYTSDAADE